jgi:hypothetical protein
MTNTPDAAGSDKAQARALAQALHAALRPYDEAPEIQKRVLSGILAAKAYTSGESIAALENRVLNAYYIVAPDKS